MTIRDTGKVVRPGELVLTTGYIFLTMRTCRADSQQSESRRCAAICLKTRRFFSEIPDHSARFLKLSGFL